MHAKSSVSYDMLYHIIYCIQPCHTIRH